MTLDFVAGIDVAGEERGFHGAILPFNNDSITGLFHYQERERVLEAIQEEPGECKKIALDSPREARIDPKPGEKTRLAERQLHLAGYSVQWTPRPGVSSSQGEWMENGEELWKLLQDQFDDDRVIETFPTAAADGLTGIDVSLPLSLLNSSDKRKSAKDYMDAAICAVVAREHYRDPGSLKPYGESYADDKYENEPDVLGPIYVLDSSG